MKKYLCSHLGIGHNMLFDYFSISVLILLILTQRNNFIEMDI